MSCIDAPSRGSTTTDPPGMMRVHGKEAKGEAAGRFGQLQFGSALREDPTAHLPSSDGSPDVYVKLLMDHSRAVHMLL